MSLEPVGPNQYRCVQSDRTVLATGGDGNAIRLCLPSLGFNAPLRIYEVVC